METIKLYLIVVLITMCSSANVNHGLKSLSKSSLRGDNYLQTETNSLRQKQGPELMLASHEDPVSPLSHIQRSKRSYYQPYNRPMDYRRWYNSPYQYYNNYYSRRNSYRRKNSIKRQDKETENEQFYLDYDYAFSFT